MKLIEYGVRGRRNQDNRYVGTVMVEMTGITWLRKERIRIVRHIQADRWGLSKRQLLKKAAKDTPYRWNIPFFP
jgi:hypothetical protein